VIYRALFGCHCDNPQCHCERSEAISSTNASVRASLVWTAAGIKKSPLIARSAGFCVSGTADQAAWPISCARAPRTQDQSDCHRSGPCSVDARSLETSRPPCCDVASSVEGERVAGRYSLSHGDRLKRSSVWVATEVFWGEQETHKPQVRQQIQGV